MRRASAASIGPRPIPRPIPRVLAAVVAILIAAVVAGCGPLAILPTPRPSRFVATPAPPPEPDPTATEVDEVPTLRPDPSGAGPDLVDAANGLAVLASYRVSVTTRGLVPATPPNGLVSMTSTLVQGEEPEARFAMVGVAGFTGGRLDAVVIGDRAWLREGGGAWTPSPGGAGDFDAAFTTLAPISLVGAFETLTPTLTRVGTETRNGRKAVHYHADAGDDAAVAAGLSKGTVDAWIASAGDLVALAIDGTWDLDGTPSRVLLRIDVTHVDDPANDVKPPI